MIEYLNELVTEGEYRKALAYADNLLLNKKNTLTDLMAIYCAQVEARIGIQEFDGAIALGRIAAEMAREQEEWDYYGTVCIHLGFANARLDQPNHAIQWWYEYLVHLMQYASVAEREGLVWYNLGLAYMAQGDDSQAGAAMNKAVRAAERIGKDRNAHGIRHALIELYLRTEKLKPVPSLLAKTAHYLRNNREADSWQQSRLFHFALRVEFAMVTNRLSRARSVALRGLDDSDGLSRHQSGFHLLLATIAERSGSMVEAMGHATAAMAYAGESKRYDLESQAADLIYRLTQASPIQALDMNRYYFSSDLDQVC